MGKNKNRDRNQQKSRPAEERPEQPRSGAPVDAPAQPRATDGSADTARKQQKQRFGHN